ncbi:putative DDE superfamily endonuclease [Lyophyllum shimeji]|uniref:DDE superfamily endonuclease n=1 Tax=Lyophyllum shimeji TaxID=47721 RepID=A0A9P3ULV8_LYOSH|nr:putative DDE superfamily endonuclease [Lyophyllum shimeji]
MPAVPIRKQLLRGAFKYARRLLDLRRRERKAREEESDSDTGSTTSSIPSHHPFNNNDASDASSLSSVSSISSISSDSEASSNDNNDAIPSDAASVSSSEAEDMSFASKLNTIRARIKYLSETRVLYPNKVHKISQLYLVLVLYKEDDHKRFRQNLRVNPETFDKLLSRISQHPIFISTGPQEQLPVEEQLAITMYRFGHFGNSASVEAIAQWAGVSAGVVVKSTRRVMTAFLSLHDDVIHWPSAAEKEAAKEWVEAASCVAWRDGWLFVDGTLIPLADKPGFHGEAYFDRKSNYSLNVQLITLPNLRIVDYVIGHCGSAHDSTVFLDSRTVKERSKLIGRGEWIWADSAYPIEAWCVTPYKKPASYVPENKQFNYWVSHVRIKSEHAVGYLKGRFQSLKGLRQQIKDERDHRRALES